jgi:hypothetical protein
MESRIYLRRFGKLIKLYKVSRTANGLYIFSGHSDNYVTYHEDGKYWVRAGAGAKVAKYIRQPLSSFSGTESLSLSNIWVAAPAERDLDESKVPVKSEDIVIDLKGIFRIELMLSASAIQLPALPERLNSRVYVKDWSPFLMIEVFQTAENAVFSSRFPSPREYVEGENFFVNHPGRI